MIEMILVAFTTFFATIGRLEAAVLFAAMTPDNTIAERRRMAIKATLIGGGVLLLFALFGDAILNLFGITLPALRTAGGILLLLIAIDLVFARDSGATGTTEAETAEAHASTDISVFPMATPLIAGPGAIGAAILMSADAQGDTKCLAAVIAALLAALLLTFILLLLAGQVRRVLGVTGAAVVSRIIGILLAALAVQFIFDGLGASGLIG